jgi:hypothetical protein
MCWLPKERQSPLVATSWEEQAHPDGQQYNGGYYRPPTFRSWFPAFRSWFPAIHAIVPTDVRAWHADISAGRSALISQSGLAFSMCSGHGYMLPYDRDGHPSNMPRWLSFCLAMQYARTTPWFA